MNLRSNYLGLIATTGLIALTIYVIVHERIERRAFIMTQEVFQKFRGTIELNNKMEALRKSNRKILDSLELQLTQTNGLQKFEIIKQEKYQQEQLLSEKYTSELWSVINKSIEEYGKDKGYEFIFGATGNGSVMYGSDAVNITSDVIDYMNTKYGKN